MDNDKINSVETELYEAYESLRSITDFEPEVALVLGSGLGGFAELLEDKQVIRYDDIKHMPVSTVKGHSGCFVCGTIGKVRVVVMKGRVHHYEGYTMDKVVLPIRLMKLMGANTLFLTNAAGGINEAFGQGALMMITDHITSFVKSPLIGPNLESLGTRFPDMSQVYDKKLQKLLRDTAAEHNIDLKEGVYVQTTGPNYETPAEIRMFAKLGADAVGMSTACEAMAARHMGMEVMGVSCITNMAAGIQKTALNHEEVALIADKISATFQKLVWHTILKLGQ